MFIRTIASNGYTCFLTNQVSGIKSSFSAAQLRKVTPRQMFVATPLHFVGFPQQHQTTIDTIYCPSDIISWLNISPASCLASISIPSSFRCQRASRTVMSPGIVSQEGKRPPGANRSCDGRETWTTAPGGGYWSRTCECNKVIWSIQLLLCESINRLWVYKYSEWNLVLIINKIIYSLYLE